jgi:glycine cleavage system pyridoxal-binding protein P
MLAAIGVARVEDLYDAIPGALMLKRPLDLPPPITSEHGLRRHVEGILAKNRNCAELLNFRGAGCWQHYVPVICDEINRRGEFLTAYAGWSYSDHGKLQAIFEYQSLIGELVGMDVVSTPTYDWGAAADSAVAMACASQASRRFWYRLPWTGRAVADARLHQTGCISHWVAMDQKTRRSAGTLPKAIGGHGGRLYRSSLVSRHRRWRRA